MPSDLLWMLVLCGLATLILKGSFIEGQRYITMPYWFREALEYVPPAILTALIIPGFIKGDPTLISLHGSVWVDPRWIGGLCAVLTYLFTQKSIPTLVGGMAGLHASYWLQ